VFNTTESVPRAEGKVRPLAALKRLARKLNVEIKFAAGERHTAYAPESKYNISVSGRKIKEAVSQKMDPEQVYTIGRPVRWQKVEGGFKEPVAGEPLGKPATRLKALRPLAAGQAQPYSAPKGKQWATVKEADIKPGETFKDVPVYERQRMNWKKYVRAQSEIEKIPTSEVWGRHRQEVQEQYAGERVGPRELRSKTVQHIQGQMKLHRDYMAGEARESLAIIRAKNASLESARAHPERMVEYKKRLSGLAKQRQEASTAARTHAGERLSRIATRGMTQIAEEHQGDWQSKLSKLHKQLKSAASPEEEHEVQKQIHQHFLIRKSPEDIKTQARGAMGLITDKPYEYGGTPLSEVSVSSIQDILQKGSRTTKPITPGRIRKLKRHMDTTYERSKFAGLSGVKQKILKERKIFTTPIAEAATGFPHLGKLGIGIGAAGVLAGGALAIHAARKRSRTQQMKSRLKEIQFAKFPIPREAQEALEVFRQAGKTGVSKSTTAIPGTWLESEKLAGKKAKPFSTFQIARQKWTKFIRAAGGSKVQDIKPMDMRALRALQETHTKNLGVIKTLREQAKTREHLGEEALKAQAEKLGAEHAAKHGEAFKKGHTLGREEGVTAAKSTYERQTGELTERLGQESARRAGRLKLIAAGTLAGGAVGGYALGRYDKRAHQRHEAREILNLYKPRQPKPREPREQRATITIGITPHNGRRQNVQFSALDKVRAQLAGTTQDHTAHDIAIGAIEGGLAYPASELLFKKFAPKGSGIGRKIAVGGLVGGAATGLVGLTLAQLKKRRKQQMSSRQRLIQFGLKSDLAVAGGVAALPLIYEKIYTHRKNKRRKREEMEAEQKGLLPESQLTQFQSQRQIVARDRYMKQIHERDIDRADRLYGHTTLIGAGIGALAARKPSKLIKSTLAGAGIGLATQKAARLYGKTTRDQFGERSWRGKRVELAPEVIGGTILAGYGLKKLAKHAFLSRIKLVKFDVRPDDPDDLGPDWLQEWAHKKLYGRTYSTIGQAQKVKKYAGRTHRLLRDVNLKRQGLPNIDPRGRPRKNEWEKPWVAGALTTAGLIATIKGGRGVINWAKQAHPQSRIGQLMEGFKRGSYAKDVPGLGKVGGFFHGAREELSRWRDKPLTTPPKYEHSKFNPVTGKMKTPAQIEKEVGEAKEKDFFKKVAQGKISKEELSSRLEEIRFQEPKRKHNVAAGLAVAAAGIPLYRGAGKFARIGLRSRIDKLAGNPTNYGKQVADYLEASQHILNQGITGKLTGSALRHPESAPVKWLIGKSPKIWDVGSPKSGIHPHVLEHYSAFRHSPASALDSWHKEAVSEWRGRKNPEVVKELKKGQKVLSAHLQDLRFRGYNEREALREATKEPLHSNYFRRLIAYKGNPVKNYQKVTTGLAAVPATAGAAVAATTRKDRNRVSVR